VAELTIDQALQQGVEAHKAGQVQEADRLYTAILQAQPKHPDANHNMGVLAVGVGKVQEALPFFKTALEANPATAQFWLSYIDTLIKLDKFADAKAVLDQARSKGAKGDGFDKLEQRLKEASEEPVVASKTPAEAQLKQPNILDSLKLDQAIKLAKKKAKDGSPEEAKLIYQDILAKFPKNKRASDGLKALASRPVSKASKAQDPPQGQIRELINLYSQGQLQLALKQAETLVQQFPNSAILFNIQGAVLKGLGQLGLSVEASNKALAIKPDYAEAYSNMGAALQEQVKLEEAIEAYNKALAIKPDYAEAKHNLAETLKIYSPKNNHRNPLINLDNKIKAKHNKHALPKIDQELAAYTSNLLNELQSADKNLSTKYLQIYRRNTVDLNCTRHMQIFKEKEIIPKFCFGCYKVQVDVTTVLDLIRLAALFYESEFESDLTRKCLVEVRPNIPGSYKGLIYCRGIDQAHSVKKQLDVHVKDIDKNLVAKIKKGCSEFPVAFPKYGEVASREEEMMQYPEEWQALESQFDEGNLITPKIGVMPSLKEFCLSDYLIIQKWIDYSKGIGDLTSELFCDLPVKYNEIMEVAKARVKQ
jgi:tetratricopeptide (TPR) repeat protein